jgi:Protein of unknown function (DUF2975)
VRQRPIPPLNARMCKGLAKLTVVSGVAFLAVNALLWSVPAWAPLAARNQAHLLVEPITLTPMVRLLGLACSTLYLGVLCWALWIANIIFKRLSVGQVFEPETGVLLRRFGLTLVVYAALTPPVGALMSLLVTIKNAPGLRRADFGISEYEIVLAIVGILILATGSVMAEAARIAEENRQIV